ncbi:MAG: type I methionyl aminopeptidase, partial [Cryomorphaceae bacterium]|nr:type I methionyl aminopeptidase [Cryomorphaceae bacterium]
MSISIKSVDQIEKMRLAGKLASSVLEMIGEHVRSGVTTEKL